MLESKQAPLQIEFAEQVQAPMKNEPLVLSIEQLNVQIKQLLENQIATVWVQGEISNFKPHTSGHFYFSLKDAKSQITAVMFRGHNSKLKFKPKDGMEVIVRGKVSVYEPRGTYQILCEMMEPVGAGALQRAFEELKEKLKKEGLFETARKKPVPSFPKHIAVVTSPTGAAIRDILNIMSRRAPNVQVTVVPTVVQGADAAPQICEAFLRAQKIPDIDVIILGRGGGSIEDLWAFNDETLARLISESLVPVISAVGHEIDFTISDFVSDLRAPTPSAAAELVAKSSQEITSKIQNLEKMLVLTWEKKFKILSQKLESCQKRLVDPKKKLRDLSLRNDDLLNRLEMAMSRFLQTRQYDIQILVQKMKSPQQVLDQKRKQRELAVVKLQNSFLNRLKNKKNNLAQLAGLLDSLSPLKVVERGYSLVTKNGKLIKSVQQIQKNDQLSIRFAQGEAIVQVEKII